MHDWTCHHISQSNPSGIGQGDPAALLRRVADSIEALGDVWVQDVVYKAEQTGGEEDLTVTVYYQLQDRPRAGAERDADRRALLREMVREVEDAGMYS